MIGVYAIICTENGRRYIGSSTRDVRERFRNHFCQLRKNNHSNTELQLDFTRLGASKFYGVILEECPKELAIEREQYHMDFYREAGLSYNIDKLARSRRGMTFNHSEEARAAISNSLLGNKRSLGVKQSPELVERRAAANRGRKRSAEFCEQMRLAAIKREAKKRGE